MRLQRILVGLCVGWLKSVGIGVLKKRIFRVLLAPIILLTPFILVSPNATLGQEPSKVVAGEEPILLFYPGTGNNIDDDELKKKLAEFVLNMGFLAGFGKLTKIEMSLRESLKQVARRRGPDYRIVEIFLGYMLAENLNDQKKYAEALTVSDIGITNLNACNHPSHLEKKNIYGATLKSQLKVSLWSQRIRILKVLAFWDRRFLELNEKKFWPEHPFGLGERNKPAIKLDDQARNADARLDEEIPAYVEFRKTQVGFDNKEYGDALKELAEWLDLRGNHKQAEKVWREALRSNILAYGANTVEVADALNRLGLNLGFQQRISEATPLFEQSLRIYGLHLVRGDDAFDIVLNHIAMSRFGWAWNTDEVLSMIAAEVLSIKSQQKKSQKNETIKKGLIKLAEKLGVEFPFSSEVGHMGYSQDAHLTFAKGLLRMGEPELALEIIREGVSNHKVRALVVTKKSTTTDWASEYEKSLYFLHLEVIAANKSSHTYIGLKLDGLIAESFEAAQLARSTSVGQALGRMAARFASGDDKLGAKVRALQDAVNDWQAHDDQLLKTISEPADKRNTDKEQRLRDQLTVFDERITSISKELSETFPAYTALTSRQPTSLKSVQDLLASDEALVSYVIGAYESYVWAVRKNDAGFYNTALSRDDLDAAVKALRGGLEPSKCLRTEEDIPPFNTTRAFELYEKIFKPVEGLLQGVRHVMVVADGALQSLPVGVLVTEKPQGGFKDFSDYKQVPWLAKKYALSTLPSVGSLKALRLFAKSGARQRAFIGIGDPMLRGVGTNDDECRGGTEIASLFRGGSVVDVKELKKLSRLPDTADELKAIAATLGADDSSLYLAERATESRVKDMDLSNTEILAFATHGLLSDELRGVQEPGLVLTPPEKGTVKDDGYLTASEVAQLKLNTDLVILSACNTASSDGTPGAEGLSGLAKAFFYAGSRALLVSHWQVESNAAMRLTIRMLKETKKKAVRGLEPPGWAEALKRSMIALMDMPGGGYLAHPMFWAPFSIVGEGG